VVESIYISGVEAQKLKNYGNSTWSSVVKV
jgi:hypothetical protein